MAPIIQGNESMTNANERANARALPETTNRRAVLRSILAAGAVATVPAAGAIAADHADAALFALQADIEAADRLKEAFFDPFNAAEEAYMAVRAPIPAAPEDSAFTKEEWFLTFKEKMAELNTSPSPEITAYAAERQAWEEEDKRLHDETGLTAAEECEKEIDAEVLALRDQIVATRATTLAGLKFKAKYAVEHYEGAPDEDDIDSIIDDILAMREREARA
jgi:hypothetical protein